MAHWDLIDRLAARRFGSSALAEEASLFVLNRLAEDNWRRLATFSGRSSFTTFLVSVSHRLLEDFSRKKFGRRRTPLWIARLGGVWLALYRVLCLERLNLVEAVERLALRGTGTDREKSGLEEKGATILERIVDCGAHQAREVLLDEARQVAGTTGTGDQEKRLAQKQKEHFLQALFGPVLATGNRTRVLGSAARIMDNGVQLKPEERLLLQMHYQDGLTVTEAGRMLGLTRFQAHGRMRRLLKRLRRMFERMGIDRELVDLLRDE